MFSNLIIEKHNNTFEFTKIDNNNVHFLVSCFLCPVFNGILPFNIAKYVKRKILSENINASIIYTLLDCLYKYNFKITRYDFIEV